jgi:hypothetical protein
MSQRVMTNVYLVIGMLILDSLACSLTGNSRVSPTISPTSDTSLEVSPTDNPGKVETTIVGPANSPKLKPVFPLPGKTHIVQTYSEAVTGTVKLSMEDIATFYRTEFTKKGLTEDKSLTFFFDTSFSIVFMGSSNGKKTIVQGTKMKNDTVAFSVRYE